MTSQFFSEGVSSGNGLLQEKKSVHEIAGIVSVPAGISLVTAHACHTSEALV